MKLTNKETIIYNVRKQFTIELDNGKEINIDKWQFEDGNEVDSDWDFSTGDDIDLYNSLNDEEQIEFDDFVLELTL